MATSKFIKKLIKNRPYSNRLTYDELINAESEIGRTIFGPIPAGHQREFFMLSNNVWIWHESFPDSNGRIKSRTIRYEVQPTGVYKKVAKASYEKINGDELDNFRRAASTYFNLVKTKLYN